MAQIVDYVLLLRAICRIAMRRYVLDVVGRLRMQVVAWRGIGERMQLPMSG